MIILIDLCSQRAIFIAYQNVIAKLNLRVDYWSNASKLHQLICSFKYVIAFLISLHKNFFLAPSLDIPMKKQIQAKSFFTGP